MTVNPLPVLRTSERGAFKRCPQKWEWEYRYGYKPKASRQADALWFGIGVHEALAPWYGKGKRRGPHPADTFEQWAGDEVRYAKTWLDDEFEDAVWEDATELGVAMLEQYVDFYGKDSDWYVIAVEEPFSVKITREGRPVGVFKSRWDGVIRWRGHTYLLEHKTASQIVTAYLELDDQGGSYLAVATQVLRARGVLKPREHIEGIVYNFLRKSMPDTRERDEDGMYLNKNGSISKRQPPDPFVRVLVERNESEMRTQLERIADEVTVMNAMRDGTLPVFKTPGKDCPRCPFWTPCVLHEQGSDAYREILKQHFVQEDPYQDYKSAAA
jgi:Zierdtviridae exonuclease